MRSALLLFLLVPLAFQVDGQSFSGSDTTSAQVDTGKVDSISKPVPPLPYPTYALDSLSFDRIRRNTPLASPFRPGLGNLGLDHYSLLQDPHGKGRIGFRPGLPEHPFAFPDGPPPTFDVRYPVTRLEYSLGSNEEQFFNITHTQNITPRWNVGIRYRKLGSPGPYPRQKTNSGNFLFSTNYREAQGHYQVKASFQADRSKIQQNGGILHDSTFEENAQNDRGAFRVNLEKAQSNSRYDEGRIQHSFFPTGRTFDSSTTTWTKLGIYHRAIGRQLRFGYIDDAPDSSFYDRIAQDSTSDLNHFERLSNQAGIVLQKWEQERNELLVRLGYRFRFFRTRLKTKVIDRRSTLKDGSILLNALWRGGKQALQAKLAYGTQGYGEGDRLALGRWTHGAGLNGIGDSIGFRFSYKERSPTYLSQHYRSNHIYWDNAFPRIKSLHARARLGAPEEEGREGFSISYTRMENAVYYDRQAMPRSADEKVLFARAQLKQRFEVGKWGLHLKGAWQKEWKSDILRLPEFIVRGGIYFETPLFDRALRARFGIRCNYYSAYRGDAYMPVTRRFYLQDEERIGDYPFLDLYFHGKVSGIMFFVEMDHGNSGLMGYQYYGAPHYPLRDRTFRLGVKWDIFN
ncbi:MAG: putative porin [Flavobacteriales bacterium]